MLSLFKQTNNGDLIYDALKTVKYDQRDIERTFARLFSTEDGRKVLGHLQVMSFHRTLSPASSDEQLRHAEGQRAMVASILRLIDRGRNP